MDVPIFSKRYKDYLKSKSLNVESISKTLRNRLWFVVKEFDERNYEYQDIPTIITSIVKDELKHKYGCVQLECFVEGSIKYERKIAFSLHDFFINNYPTDVFDTIELFYDELNPYDRDEFQNKINSILEEERYPWILVRGLFFKIDSLFFEKHIYSKTEQFLADDNFAGALDEYKKAREYLTKGEYSEAILYSNKSFESVLKVITNDDSGIAKKMIDGLLITSIYNELPDDFVKGFGEKVLSALPFIRNKLSGHGQGSEIIKTPKCVAELAINLSGTYINFLITRYNMTNTNDTSSKDKTNDN